MREFIIARSVFIMLMLGTVYGRRSDLKLGERYLVVRIEFFCWFGSVMQAPDLGMVAGNLI